MADGPATQIRDLLSRWADAPVAPRDVLADLDRRGWRSIVSPADPSLLIADPGWGHEQGYFLLVAFGDDGLAGFTAYLPAGFPDDPVPSAVTVGTEAQRLWGDGNRLGPGWLAWPTPRGRCEMRQAEVTVVSWLHAGAG